MPSLSLPQHAVDFELLCEMLLLMHMFGGLQRRLMSLTSNGQSTFDIRCGVPLPVYCQHRLEKAARCGQRAVLRRAESQDEGPQEGGVQPGVIRRLILPCYRGNQRTMHQARDCYAKHDRASFAALQRTSGRFAWQRVRHFCLGLGEGRRG